MYLEHNIQYRSLSQAAPCTMVIPDCDRADDYMSISPLASLDSQLSDLPIQIGALDSEGLGGIGDFPVMLLQDMGDLFPFKPGPGPA